MVLKCFFRNVVLLENRTLYGKKDIKRNLFPRAFRILRLKIVYSCYFPSKGVKAWRIFALGARKNGRANFWKRGLGKVEHLLGSILSNNFQAWSALILKVIAIYKAENGEKVKKKQNKTKQKKKTFSTLGNLLDFLAQPFLIHYLVKSNKLYHSPLLKILSKPILFIAPNLW